MKAKLSKKHIVSAIAVSEHIPKETVRRVLDAFAHVVALNLTPEQEVVLPEIGILRVKEIPPRAGRNPATGEPMQLPAHRRFSLSPAKALRDQVGRPGDVAEVVD